MEPMNGAIAGPVSGMSSLSADFAWANRSSSLLLGGSDRTLLNRLMKGP